MSNDTSSQTLFRFTSLRNPQLTETQPNENLGFIHKSYKDEHNGKFDIVIDGWNTSSGTKVSLLEKEAAKLEKEDSLKPVGADLYLYKTEEDVKHAFPELCDLGKKLVKNEMDEINTILLPISEIDRTKLWDNLIYQVVTQRNFYTKEAIIQVLKANHFLLNSQKENHEKLREAKVVLPAKLFLDSFTEDISSDDSTSNILTVAESYLSEAYIANVPKVLSASQALRLTNIAEKNQQKTLASTAITRLTTLKKELDSVYSFYKKE